MKSLLTIGSIIASLPLFGLGVLSMFVPTSMYEMLKLRPQALFGINTIRSDIGGMLVSSAVMIWIGLWKRNTTWLQATMLLMVALLTGRTISTIADGFTVAAIPAIVVEIYTVVVLYFSTNQFDSSGIK